MHHLVEQFTAAFEKRPPDVWVAVGATWARHGCSGHRLSGPEGRPVSSALDIRLVAASGFAEDGSPVMAPGLSEYLVFYRGVCPRCGAVAVSRPPQVWKVLG